MSIPKRFHHPTIEAPNSLLLFVSTISKSNTGQDILPRSMTKLEMEGKKIFTCRQMKSAVRWPSKHDFGPGSNMQE